MIFLVFIGEFSMKLLTYVVYGCVVFVETRDLHGSKLGKALYIIIKALLCCYGDSMGLSYYF